MTEQNKCEVCRKPIGEKGKIYIAGSICRCMDVEISDLQFKLSAIETAGLAMIEAKKEIEIAKYEAERSGLRVRPAETKYLLAKEEFNQI